MEQGKVVAFLGADAKVGTTTIVHLTAGCLSEAYPDKKVILLHCGGNRGLDFSAAPGFDEIRTFLETSVLTIEQLLDACYKPYANLYILPGAKQIAVRRSIRPQDIKSLVNLATKESDIVLIDVGRSLEYGAAVGGMQSAGLRLLVTTQQMSALLAYWEQEKQILSPLTISFDGWIVNKFRANPPLLTTPELMLQYEFEEPCIAALPAASPIEAWIAEQEQRPIMQTKDIDKEIKRIAEFIALSIGLHWPDKKRKEGRFWKRNSK